LVRHFERAVVDARAVAYVVASNATNSSFAFGETVSSMYWCRWSRFMSFQRRPAGRGGFFAALPDGGVVPAVPDVLEPHAVRRTIATRALLMGQTLAMNGM
jgi:hypothetical protein